MSITREISQEIINSTYLVITRKVIQATEELLDRDQSATALGVPQVPR
jgi:hypothetical protein